jgi:plasmid stabilization system protein ParE
MTWRVIHTSKAERDIGSAASWYENQKHHLGHEFLDEILAVEDSLSQHPSIYPVMHKDIRRVATKRFPYAVYFVTKKRTVIIIAVLHMRRDPNIWKKRI